MAAPSSRNSTSSPSEAAASSLPRQIGRFVLVGIVAAAVDFAVLLLLMSLGLGHTPAKAVSFIAGTAVAYLANVRWTFRAQHSGKRLGAVMAVYLTTFAVQVGLFSVLFGPLLNWHGLRFAQVVGFVIAQGVATTINFLAQRWIFRHR